MGKIEAAHKQYEPKRAKYCLGQTVQFLSTFVSVRAALRVSQIVSVVVSSCLAAAAINSRSG